MARLLLSTAAAIMLAGVSLSSPTSQAQSQVTYMASVPFDFQVEQSIMPAGTYLINSVSPHTLLMRNRADGRAAYLPVFPVDDSGNVSSGQLRFARYGAAYFLHEFSAPTEGGGRHAASRCIPTRAEKRAVRNLAGLTTLAQHSQEIVINSVLQR